jgi:hypothetical protein
VLSLPKTKRVFVAAAPCDMRKQFDGLADRACGGLVLRIQLQPLNESVVG